MAWVSLVDYIVALTLFYNKQRERYNIPMKAVLYNYVAVHVVDERKNLLVISGVCIQLPYFKIIESFDVVSSCKCSLSRTFIVLLLSTLLITSCHFSCFVIYTIMWF